jgi:hypothetical protein
MKDLILRVLALVLVGEAITLTVINKKPEEKVLSEASVVTPIPTPTPTETPTATPSPTPTPVPTPKPTVKPTPTPIPPPTYTSEEINGFINRFAAQYGVDPNVLRHIALCESGFNPKASNAGYAGLFQFGTTTWKNIRKEIGEDVNPDLRFNAEEASQTAAYALSHGKSAIWPNCTP